MSIFFNRDILHTILSYSDFKTISSIICLNTEIKHMCSDNLFWKCKFTTDYNTMNPQSDNWLLEYRKVYASHKMASEFVDIFINLKEKYSRDQCYNLSSIDLPDDIDFRELYWLQELVNFPLDKYDVNIFKLHFEIHDYYEEYEDVYIPEFKLQLQMQSENDPKRSIYVDKQTFINCITKLCYDYKNLVLDDDYGDEFLFGDTLVVILGDVAAWASVDY